MSTAPVPSPELARRLVVEVIDARDLLPKDGLGTSSAYVVVDYDGQRKRTRTVARDLNPRWDERLEFAVSDPASMHADELDVHVYNDRRFAGGGGATAGKNHFLGRVRIYGSQFACRGDEGLVYFPLEKRSLLSWIRGEIGLKIYYYDEPPPPPADVAPPPELPPAVAVPPDEPPPEVPAPSNAAVEMQPPPTPAPVLLVEEVPPAMTMPVPEPEIAEPYPPELRKARIHVAPRPVMSARLDEPPAPPAEQQSAYNLVEPMQYLFVRIVKGRGLRPCEGPVVKVRTGAHSLRSKPGRDGGSGSPDWNQVFAVSHSRPSPTLEVSVWAAAGGVDTFLGGVCLDLSDVPVREHPDGGPLAPQWYRLESGEPTPPAAVSGDVMLSVWIGTQADEAFAEAWSTDAPHVNYTRAKVYQSPKLWYLRATVIEAQDLRAPPPLPGMPADVRVKMQLGFQSARTRRPAAVTGAGSGFTWAEDLLFVASEPLEEQLLVLVEDRSAIKEPALLGHVAVPFSGVEQRLDERQLVASKWYNLAGDGGDHDHGQYAGRLHLRLCLEGGYHVLDEAAHLCSDYRPTAKQLWKPAVGVLELGIIGARGLLPMKTKAGGVKGSTDAYCVAKYGKKWVRTRTVADSFDPKWNEQYLWQVYDPCTVLTVAVFDNWRMFAGVTGDHERPDCPVGKVRIRLSTLETNRAYTAAFPLVVLLRSGLKKMGELTLAVRFASAAVLPDTVAIYCSPLLPRMHYLRPIPVAQQEALRGAAVKTVAAWLARSEPPLGPEAVKYVLDADAHTWSMRKAKANWFRIMGVVAWLVGLSHWLDGIKRWRSPATTVMVHLLYLVLVWYPELAVPTAALYAFMVTAWYYRFRSRSPAGMDVRLSQADIAEGDELEEEFDAVVAPAEAVRGRYERLRVVAARVQRVMGDVAAQGERAMALVSWRDPRASRIFAGGCLAVAVVMYAAPAKVVAVALGFYYLRHPMFRDPMPPPALNFFRRLPSLSDRLL